MSNTWHLLNDLNWSGVLIEADEDRYQELCLNYTEKKNSVRCVQRLVTLSGKDSLQAILSEDNDDPFPVDFDFLSIDIDGADYHVWDSLSTFTPKVVCIEFNPSIPNHIEFIQPCDMTIYQGSSLLSIVLLGKSKGYELVSTTTFNAIFVQSQFYSLFHIDDNSLEYMHDVPMPTDMFQLYDGTLVYTGCKKLIWRNVRFDDNQLQMLPQNERHFPLAPITKKDCDNQDNIEFLCDQSIDIFNDLMNSTTEAVRCPIKVLEIKENLLSAASTSLSTGKQKHHTV